MLVRSLLAAPSAAGYFHKAVLLSDPMAYGFYNSSTITTLQNNFFPSVGCTTTNSTCHNALSLGDIMDAQMSFNPVDYDASTAGQIPFRPSKDGTLITKSLTTTFPSSPKPLLVTTAHDEAAVFIYGSLPELPAAYYSAGMWLHAPAIFNRLKSVTQFSAVLFLTSVQLRSRPHPTMPLTRTTTTLYARR